MRSRKRRFFQSGLAMLILASALVILVTWSSAAPGGGAQHVRWDIVSTTGMVNANQSVSWKSDKPCWNA